MSNGSFDVNFTDISSLSSTPFNNIWGDSDEHSLSSNGLWLGSVGTDYTPMGIMQNPTGASAGEGYGLYSYSARYEYANQPGGDYLLLWRADNQWLDSAAPGLITEMDMLETFDNSSSMASTLHYYQSSASGGDGYSSHNITGIDLTALNVYSMDWEAGSLTFYIDGKEIYQITGSTVPKDYAQGGSNQVMGMGAESETSKVGMYVTEAQYTSTADLATAGGASTVMAAQMSRAGLSTSGVSTSTGSTSTGSTSTGGTSTGGTSTGTPTTGIIADTAAITVSAPGTVQAATAGAAVTVAETITGTANATVYEAVFTSGYSAEESWTAVKLNSAGTATVNVTFEHSGDLMIVASDTSGKAAENAYSSAITITNPASATIAVSAPGSVQEASVGAGVTVTETIKATGLTTAYAEVLTASGAVETGFQAVTIGSGGTGTVSLHLAKTGDYVEVVDKTSSPAVIAKSTAVTITDPAVAAKPTIAVSAPGSVQEASKGAGVTVTETITATGLSTVYAEVLTKTGTVESAYQAVNLTNGTGTVSLHLASSGDVVQVASSLSSPVVTAVSSAVSITDPTTTTTTTTAPSSSLFSITSITEVKGELVVVGTRDIGEASTVREFVDGSYKGVIWDNEPDGAFTYTLAAPTTAGSHTLELTLDKSSLTASMSFITSSSGTTTTGLGTVAAGTSGGTSATTSTSSSAPASSASSTAASGLVISSLTEDAGRILVTGDKDTGSANTLRETMDGKYLGTLHDGMADGTFSMQIADVAAGAHVLLLTLDGSSATATYDFTKSANGSIQALLPTSTSASTLVAANHETTAMAA